MSGSEPRTEWGRTFSEAIDAMDRLDPLARSTPVDWRHGICAIEDESWNAALSHAEQAIANLPGTQDNATTPPTPEDEYVERSEVDRAIDELRRTT